MADWDIRRTELADVALLVACIDAAYAIYAARGIGLPAVSDGIADDIQDNIVWAAVQDAKMIGGLVLIARQYHAMLANVAVDLIATGRGLGRALIHHAEREAQKAGFQKLKLTTHVDMPGSLLLYTHLGWHETSRRVDKVFMEKQLPA
jgi:GNAT superfamily N-acetyltransferase